MERSNRRSSSQGSSSGSFKRGPKTGGSSFNKRPSGSFSKSPSTGFKKRESTSSSSSGDSKDYKRPEGNKREGRSQSGTFKRREDSGTSGRSSSFKRTSGNSGFSSRFSKGEGGESTGRSNFKRSEGEDKPRFERKEFSSAGRSSSFKRESGNSGSGSRFNKSEGGESTGRSNYKRSEGDDKPRFERKEFGSAGRSSSFKRPLGNSGSGSRFNKSEGGESTGRSHFKRNEGENKPRFERKDFGSAGRSSSFKRPSGNSGSGSRFNKSEGGESTRTSNFKRTEGDEKPYSPKKYGNNSGSSSSFSKRTGGSKYSSAPKRGFHSKDASEKTDPKAYGESPNSKRTEKEHIEKDSENVRLNRYIANSGVCSRREADVLIADGLIKVNGVQVTEMGFQVKPGDSVKYGNKVLNREKPVYLLLNKPKDFITTTNDPEERNTVMHLVKNACKERLYPVGRLDRNTTGLLLLTNDGELTEKLTHPSFKNKKIYQAELNRPISPEDAEAILDGLYFEEGKAIVDSMAVLDATRTVVGIEIHIGWNRIVRRMFEAKGYDVEKLDRVSYAGLTKKDLPRGHYRFLTDQEVVMLKHFK